MISFAHMAFFADRLFFFVVSQGSLLLVDYQCDL